ncbi:CMRF35-like molecule 8 [Festucalex cinctus]
MEIFFLLMAFLIQGSANMETQVTGVSGENITITCSDDYFLDHVKYFCKKDCRYANDVLIKSRGATWYSNGKYSIRDAKRQFYVTIFHLTMKDAGTYWCVWERNILDEYKKISLTVREATTPAPKPTTTPPKRVHPSTSASMKPLYIGVSLGVLTLALAIVLLIYFKQQKGKISTHSEEEKDESPPYAMVSKAKIKSSGTLPSSVAQSQDTSRYGDSIPPDSLYYSTVSHHSPVDGNEVSNEPANVTYSTVMFTDESPVYCNV